LKVLWRIYDDREMEYLKSCGFRYELLCKDIRTNTKMFIYLNSQELQENLSRYKTKVLED
jgi:hypothetical protein